MGNRSSQSNSANIARRGEHRANDNPGKAAQPRATLSVTVAFRRVGRMNWLTGEFHQDRRTIGSQLSEPIPRGLLLIAGDTLQRRCWPVTLLVTFMPQPLDVGLHLQSS
jgi:hypothetical protein